MSAPALFRKELGGLRPIGDAANEVLRRIKLGDTVQCDVRKPRNLKHLAKYWVLLKLIADNMPGTVTPEMLHTVIKIRLGYVDLVRTKSGDVAVPQSYSITSMSQADFEVAYEKVVGFICAEIIPTLNREALISEVNSLLDGHP